MEEELKKRHGYTKAKEPFTFDDGLAEHQSAFLVVAHPLLAALTALDSSGGEDEDEGADPDAIKDQLEDALVLLGNANFKLNAWRQKRFSEFLTEVGNRTLQEVYQQISTFSRISSMQRSRVNMTITQLIASSSARQPPNTSPRHHKEGAGLSWKLPHHCEHHCKTVELEGNRNGDMAPGSTHSLPKGSEQ